MLDTPTSENIEDFRQRYRGTYGFLQRENKSELLVYIKDTDNNKVTFTDVNNHDFFANLNMQVMFKFLPIIRGWYQTRVGPRYFTRIAERQYHRGISRGNTCVYYFDTKVVRPDVLSLEKLEDVFVIKPIAPFSIYDDFVLNKYFLFSGKNVLMYDRIIGTTNPTRTEVVLDNTLFKQELTDSITRASLNIKVVYND